MIVLDEKPWRFEFDDETPYWKWILYADNNRDFLKVKKVVPGTKSTDFIGIYLADDRKDAICLEIKYYADELDLPSADSQIIEALAQKVRDTMACIVGGSRNSTHHSTNYSEWIESAQNTDTRVYAAFFVDFPRTWPINKIKATRGIFLQRLKQKLSWLTSNIILIDQADYSDFFKGLAVSRI